MRKERYLFTSESVAIGHPDKIADQVSDAILDAILEQDPYGRVACETLVKTGLVLIAGEITTTANVDIPAIARETIKEIGYTDPAMGFDYRTCAVVSCIDKQSPDIAMGVDERKGKKLGAGDQGMMIGFACNETPELMPLPIMISHQLVEGLAKLRESKELPYLRPDGKSQVTVEYENHIPKRVHTVVVSTQHSEDVDQATIKKDLINKLIKKVIPSKYLDDKTVFHVNPTGRFVVGGPKGDCGLTGRKIIVDTYGGRARHGGGAFSGKDPTKVDRSANYAARYVAKNIVAAGLADRCEVQLSYAIGLVEPTSVLVHCEGSSKLSEHRISEIAEKVFDLTPGGIIEKLKLRRPIYKDTARYGHFGRKGKAFTWEETDMVEALKKEAGLREPALGRA
ncbi:MAG TPA: methionine adenosyltransferase [Candidatus Tripitaka californicus]|uniref:methionine adenosyltransferase n=1 Tax=Candidatus Tripitaka californicus TaxID=3367616 RepID=UPI0040285952|nr:methionine adenosyltransferase [Planctomycetota bacterium]